MLGKPAILPRGITVEGDGLNATTLRCTDASQPCLVFADYGGGSLPRTMQGGIRDLTLIGNGGSSTGVLLGGDPTGVASPPNWFGNDIVLQSAEIAGFGDNVRLGNNAFLDTFVDVLIFSAKGRGFYEPEGLNNSGENVRFFGGQFNNNRIPFELSNQFGETTFYGASFDFNLMPSTGKFMFASFYGCHFEQAYGPFVDTGSSEMSGNSSLLFEGGGFFEDQTHGITPEFFNLRGPLDQLTISSAEFGSNHFVSQIVNIATAVSKQLVNIFAVRGYGSIRTMPRWINVGAVWPGLHIFPENPTAPPPAGIRSFGSSDFSHLPKTCTPGGELYCENCKSVSDGVSMASGCVANGSGSLAVCKQKHSWTCGE